MFCGLRNTRNRLFSFSRFTCNVNSIPQLQSVNSRVKRSVDYSVGYVRDKVPCYRGDCLIEYQLIQLIPTSPLLCLTINPVLEEYYGTFKNH